MKAYTLALLAAMAISVSAMGATLGIVVAEGGSADGAPQTEMLARGFTSVGVFDENAGSIPLASLASFDVVLAYTDSSPSDATALGDVLADYVDGGGRLVLGTGAHSYPWAIGGRIMTAGYSPFVNVDTNTDVTGVIVPVNPLDPIFSGVNMAGITIFHNGNYANPDLDAGAVLLATDGAGIEMLARNAAGNVYALNVFPSDTIGGNNGDFYDLLANTLGATNVPEPTSLALLSLTGLLLARRRAS